MNNPLNRKRIAVAVAAAAVVIAALVSYRLFISPDEPAQEPVKSAEELSRETAAVSKWLADLIVSAAENAAEQKNRRIVEAVLGYVTDEEWQQAWKNSTEPGHHVQASAIIDLRYELEKREVDRSAAEFKKQMEKQNSDFQQAVANIEAETKRKTGKILADGERQRREENERDHARQEKQIDEAKRELAALKHLRNDRTEAKIVAEMNRTNAEFKRRLNSATNAHAGRDVFLGIQGEIEESKKGYDARIEELRKARADENNPLGD